MDLLRRAGMSEASAIKALAMFGNVSEIGTATAFELERAGVSPRAAEKLAAAFAIGRRAIPTVGRRLMGNASDVAELLRPLVANLAQEAFWVVAIDARNALIGGAIEVGRGSISEVVVHPREVFRGAIRVGAVGIIIAHNHPSGDPTPSTQDIALTRRIREVGTLVGIPVIDHVIVTVERHTSLYEWMGSEW